MSCETESDCDPKVGDRLILVNDIYDDGEDHHPPGFIGLAGDTVVVREIRHGRIYVSHVTVTNNAFLVYENEIKKT